MTQTTSESRIRLEQTADRPGVARLTIDDATFEVSRIELVALGVHLMMVIGMLQPAASEHGRDEGA